MGVSMRDLLYAKARLDEVAGTLDHTPTPTEVVVVVVEIGLPQDFVMIAGYANGDARLFHDSGGGLLGDLFQFANIAEAAKALCAAAQPSLEQLTPESTVPPPPALDIVRISALTLAQLYSREAPGPEIIKPGHPLNATFAAANNLFDQLNQLQESADAQKEEKPGSK